MGVRILLADNHGVVRGGLRSLLERQPGMEVIAEAENGRATVTLSRQLKPDVVIMDITMPDLNGIEATRQIVEGSPGVKVLALSMHSARKLVTEMLAAGASGYLLKHSAFEELGRALQVVMDNQIYLSPRIAGIVVDTYLQGVKTPVQPRMVPLTGREREVLQLFAEGKSTKEIAARLNVSVSTVESHRKQIMDKARLRAVWRAAERRDQCHRRPAADAPRPRRTEPDHRQLPVVHADSAQSGVLLRAAGVRRDLRHRRADLAVRAHPSHHTRRSYPWECGYGQVNARMQYTATAFSQPIQRIFAPVWDLREEIDEKRHPAAADRRLDPPPGAGVRQVLVAAL